MKENRFAEKYTVEEKSGFEAYLRKQIDKIAIPCKDVDYLWERMLMMYSNTLKNYLLATGKPDC
jgi:hypothetical protein